MADVTCSVDGCARKADKRGWCSAHYRRWLLYGNPLTILTYRGQPLEAQFFGRVDKGEGHGCWEWTGPHIKGGYGQFRVPNGKGKQRGHLAHRWSYEHHIGPIPEGLTLDHLCVNPPCVNPAHLEPVTQRENNLRGDGVAGRNARKTHCPAGHLYDEANTYIRPTDGGRDCKTCINRRSRERNQRRRVARTV